MLSQNAMVLEHLKDNVGLTPAEAYSRYGILRLAARIADLRERGFHIETIRRKEKNKFGQDTTFAEYRLMKGEADGKSIGNFSDS